VRTQHSLTLEGSTKRGTKLGRKGSQDAWGRNPRQDGDARTISRGNTQNGYSKEGHDGYPHINPVHHRSLVVDERKGPADKEIQVDPSDADKKLHISTELEAK
jgi:hypothetical protein